jgi:drug/metabolite transporter (DMT)-like permease
VSLAKVAVSHFVPNPHDPRHRYRQLDVRDLTAILEIDIAGRTCTAESGVTSTGWLALLACAALPIGVVLLVLLSAVAHAAWNALLKRCREPESAAVAMAVVCALATAVIALAMRSEWPPARALPWCLLAGVLEVGYFVMLARALAGAPLGLVYTVVRGGALLVVWPVSVLALGEEPTALRIAGTALVVLGLIASGVGTESSLRAAPQRPLVIAVLCACFLGGTHLAYKVALSRGAEAAPASSLALLISATAYVMISGRGRRAGAIAAIRAQPVHVVGGGVLAGLGFLLFLLAMQDHGAGLVLALRNTSIVFAQIFALGMGERPRRPAWIGALLVFAGAVALTI